jgi:ATP synthase F1 delta subunit
MKNTTIPTRYARALLELAAGQNRIDAFGEQVKDFLDVLQQRPGAIAQLDDHHIVEQDRASRVLALMETKTYDPLIKNFFLLLSKKHRTSFLATIYEKYVSLANLALGRLPVTITSSHALSDTETNRVTDLLTRRFQKKMIVTKKLDPSLLGGLRVCLGDHVFDYTLATHLEKLRKGKNTPSPL